MFIDHPVHGKVSQYSSKYFPQSTGTSFMRSVSGKRIRFKRAFFQQYSDSYINRSNIFQSEYGDSYLPEPHSEILFQQVAYFFRLTLKNELFQIPHVRGVTDILLRFYIFLDAFFLVLH